MKLKIYQKAYDMVLFSYPALKNFPKAERHTLVATIKKSMYKVLELITKAQKSSQKLRHLYSLDTELEILSTKVRLVSAMMNSGSQRNNFIIVGLLFYFYNF